MPTYPLLTLAAQVTAAGISAPSFVDIYQSLRASFQRIYGTDGYIDPDSQDGQLLAVMTAAINDCNQMAIAVFNAYSPTYGQGAGLSSMVKINGLQRLVASNSTAVGTVVGVAGTVITNGQVRDEAGNSWTLPTPTTIPLGGSIDVTVTAAEVGAVAAPSGTINIIATPTFGWQTFVSTEDAVAGAPVEPDASLRARQSVSTTISSRTPLASMYAALANLTGVERLVVYENYTGATNGDGIPAHTICVVVQGGDLTEIATTIGQKKTPGAGTYGTTTETYLDPITGISYSIHFYVLATLDIKVHVTGTAKTGYGSAVATEIKNSVADYVSSLGIGEDVIYTKMFQAAYLSGAADASTYDISAITIQINGVGSPGVADLVIPFNKAAICVAGTDVTVSIT